ncbi:MAG: hypothetical protein AAF571_02810 [Verrucomicrobiota bacterium]
MKNSITKNLFPLLILTTISLTLSGCNRPGSNANTEDPHAGHDHAAAETHFVAGKGVQLSEQGRASVGLETTEVKESSAPSVRAFNWQAFRHADEASASSGTYRRGYAYASVILPSGELKALKPAQTFQALQNGELFQASILEIDRQLEPVTGEAEMIIEIADPDSLLKIGSFIEGHLNQPGGQSDYIVSIPKEAVLKTARGEFVYVANSEFFYRAPIKVKGENQDQALISDGLFEGDIVASRGVQQLYLIELQTTNGGQGCAHGH